MAEYQEYITRRIVRETEKAYLVEQTINNRRDGSMLKFKWVAKSVCKDYTEIMGEKYVAVPEWLVGNGVW